MTKSNILASYYISRNDIKLSTSNPEENDKKKNLESINQMVLLEINKNEEIQN